MKPTKNHAITLRVNAEELAAVIRHLDQKGVSLTSTGDALNILLSDYIEREGVEVPDIEETISLFETWGLSAKRLKFAPHRSGTGSFKKLAKDLEQGE